MNNNKKVPYSALLILDVYTVEKISFTSFYVPNIQCNHLIKLKSLKV